MVKHVGYSRAGRSRGWVAPCAVCTWHVETRSASLLVEPQNQVFASLASKLVATVSPGLASKPVVDFLVEPQNQGSGGCPSLGLKTGSSGLVICALKSPRQFLG
jgi:hypothetical protein